MTKYKKLVTSLLAFIAAALFVSLASCNSYAVDLNYNLNDYDLVYTSNFPSQYCYYSANIPSTSGGQCVLNESNGTTFYGLTSESFAHSKDDLVEFYLDVTTPIKFNEYGNLGFYVFNYGTSVNDWRIINFEEVVDNTFSLPYGTVNLECTAVVTSTTGGYVCTGSDGSSYNGLQFSKLYRVTAVAYKDGNGPIGVIGTSSIPMATCKTIGDDCRIRMFGIRRWALSADSSKNVLKGIRDSQEEETQAIQDQNDSINQDREESSNSAGGFSFDFSLPNPFEIFSVQDGCVNTPTIDSWLHLEGDWKSPHCPVIPQNVRNTLTPVVTLIVSLAVLMVIIRWVSSSSVDVASGVGLAESTPKNVKKGGK